jgi:hypothetical protein
MLHIVHQGNSLPYQLPADPAAEFMPGMMGQMMVSSGLAALTVSNGKCPMFIIDAVRTKAFVRNIFDEQHIIPVPNAVMGPNGKLVCPADIPWFLENPNIIPKSFATTLKVVLKAKNGGVIIPAGTELNTSVSGSGFDAIYFRCKYTHEIGGYPGHDSTMGGKRVTVYYGPMIIQTDQIETNVQYALNSPVYCSPEGKFTTQRYGDDYPAIAAVMCPPSTSSQGMAEFKVYL